MIRKDTMADRRFEIDQESLPNLPGMMLVTVEALKKLGGSTTIQELDERVIELEGADRSRTSFHNCPETRIIRG